MHLQFTLFSLCPYYICNYLNISYMFWSDQMWSALSPFICPFKQPSSSEGVNGLFERSEVA